MQIYVKARSFFEARQGTTQERELFRYNRIISINNVSFPAEPPPFSEKFLDAENLLILYFDDVDEGFPNAMTPKQAREIVNFVRLEDNRPIIVHCTAGISRSGAVGEVLNWYFNRYVRLGNESESSIQSQDTVSIPKCISRRSNRNFDTGELRHIFIAGITKHSPAGGSCEQSATVIGESAFKRYRGISGALWAWRLHSFYRSATNSA